MLGVLEREAETESGDGRMRVLSLGAGVQSTTMALMAAAGEITPMPDCAIFADTGWEPQAVYVHLNWLMSPGVLPFPVYIVSAGNLRINLMANANTTGQRFASVPWHMTNPDDGKAAMGRRQCTKEYKLTPIKRKIASLLNGNRSPGSVEMWIGISIDEAGRMKPSRVKYVINRFPLIEKSMSRNSCLEWIKRNGFPRPPKSSCIGCPYHSDDQWRALSKEEFADAVEVDGIIRNQPKFLSQQFMHRKRIPLFQVDLLTAEERGQVNLFENECEGMCGL